MEKYYLYRYIRLDKNEPFYIGIGTKTPNDLKYYTYTRANSFDKRNKIWKRIVAKTEYVVEILLESNDYEFIKQKEIEFIKLYGRIDLSTGTLTNMTDGGEGTLNVVVSQYSRDLRSRCHKGRVISQESLLKRSITRKEKGFKQSFESKKKISISKSFPVLQFTLTGEFIKEWNNSEEASKKISVNKVSIMQCANINNLKCFTGKNYIWIYKKDYENKNLSKFNIALERVKTGRIKTNISANQKNEIIEKYFQIKDQYKFKQERLNQLSQIYGININTIRAIVYSF